MCIRDSMEHRVMRARRDVVPPAVTIPAEIQALDRNTVLARLEILRQNAKVQYAHRHPVMRARRDVVPPAVTIPAEIQALDRNTVLARLEILRQNAKVQYAHRH